MGKTVAEKLLIKPGTTVWSSHADRVPLLGALPDGVRLVDEIAGATIAVMFADDAASAHAMVGAHERDLASPKALWVAYPKGNRADVNRDSLWPILADRGFRPITQISIDDTWSALRFRPLQEGEERFAGGRSV